MARLLMARLADRLHFPLLIEIKAFLTKSLSSDALQSSQMYHDTNKMSISAQMSWHVAVRQICGAVLYCNCTVHLITITTNLPLPFPLSQAKSGME